MPVLKTDEGYVVSTSGGKRLSGPYKTEQEANVEDNVVEQIVVGEAANQGEAGLRMVAEILRNRTMLGKKDIEQVATKPHQFSALEGFPATDKQGKPRIKPLHEFYKEQPEQVRSTARFVLNEVLHPAYEPQLKSPTGYLPPENYLTAKLYNSPKRPAWAKDMKVVAEVGDHVVLARKAAKR